MKFVSAIVVFGLAVMLSSTVRAQGLSDKPEPVETMSYVVELPLAFDDATERTIKALKEESFGVITRIDLHETFKEKLDVEMKPLTILGVCNPKLAYKAVSNHPEVAMMLPCKVTLQSLDKQRTVVRIMNPVHVMASAGMDKLPVIREVGEHANDGLKRVAESLAESP